MNVWGGGGGDTNLQLFEEVEHGHTHHDDQEGSQRRDHVHGRHAPPLLEEDDGGGQDHGGEEDVVDEVDQQGVEGVQRLVQVVHLQAGRQADTHTGRFSFMDLCDL